MNSFCPQCQRTTSHRQAIQTVFGHNHGALLVGARFAANFVLLFAVYSLVWFVDFNIRKTLLLSFSIALCNASLFKNPKWLPPRRPTCRTKLGIKPAGTGLSHQQKLT